MQYEMAIRALENTAKSPQLQLRIHIYYHCYYLEPVTWRDHYLGTLALSVAGPTQSSRTHRDQRVPA